MNCRTYPSDRIGFTAFRHSSLTLGNPFTSPFQVCNLNAIYSQLKKDPSVNRMSLSYDQRNHYCSYNGVGSITQRTIWGGSLFTCFHQCFVSTHRIKGGCWIWGLLLLWLVSYGIAAFCVWEKSLWVPALAPMSSSVCHQHGFWFDCLKVLK